MSRRLLGKVAPLGIFVALTALCLALKENFPFTHYPMYSDFSDQSYYVWIGDAEGEPIAIQNLTGLRTGRIKKVYNNGLQAVRAEVRRQTGSAPRKRDLTAEQRRAPGGETLAWLVGAAPDGALPALRAASPLRLYQVDITIDRGRVVESEPLSIAEFAVP